MNQTTIGKYIARKRKEQNLTQEQLAEQLGVSNKTVSKWENGKGMPDSSIMLDLCNELKISVNELLSGEMIKMNNYNEKAEQNLLEMKITYSNWNYSFYYWSIICNKNRTSSRIL